MKFLEKNLIALDIEVSSPEEAIRVAGELLLNENLVEESYIEAMINSFKKNGPYFVLAPQIALPHARPEDGVNEASVSFVRLQEPIAFGSKVNDPVQLVFALGAGSTEEHLQLLQNLTLLLNKPANIEQLKTAKDYAEIKTIIGGNKR